MRYKKHLKKNIEFTVREGRQMWKLPRDYPPSYMKAHLEPTFKANPWEIKEDTFYWDMKKIKRYQDTAMFMGIRHHLKRSSWTKYSERRAHP